MKWIFQGKIELKSKFTNIIKGDINATLSVFYTVNKLQILSKKQIATLLILTTL